MEPAAKEAALLPNHYPNKIRHFLDEQKKTAEGRPRCTRRPNYFKARDTPWIRGCGCAGLKYTG